MQLLYFINLGVALLTRSQGGSLGKKTEGEEVVGEVAATGISVHSLVGAAFGDMAMDKSREQKAVTSRWGDVGGLTVTHKPNAISFTVSQLLFYSPRCCLFENKLGYRI